MRVTGADDFGCYVNLVEQEDNMAVYGAAASRVCNYFHDLCACRSSHKTIISLEIKSSLILNCLLHISLSSLNFYYKSALSS